MSGARAARVRDRVTRELDAHLGNLAELVAFAGTADRPDDLRATARFLVAAMRRAGLAARLFETQGAPIAYGEWRARPGAPTLLVYGHYDVQPAEPLSLWRTPPFSPRVTGGRMFGRGTGDNKGQHLAQVLAIGAVLAEFGELPVTVKVMIEGEEESGSPHLADFADRHRDLLAADLAYTSDGSLHSSGAPLVVLGCRGYLYADVEVAGARADLHSGTWGGVAPNPAQRLAVALAALFDDSGAVAVPGFYDSVVEPGPADLAAVAALPDDGGQLVQLGIATSLSPAVIQERVRLRPNLNIAGVSSGYSGDGIQTIVPSRAVAKLDARLVPDQDPQAVFEQLRAAINAIEPSARLTLRGAMPPSRTPLGSPLVSAVRRGVAVGFGRPPLIVPALASTLPDYVFTKVLGIPSVIVPYANADQSNHGPDENLVIDNFVAGIRCFAAVMDSLGGAPDLR